MRMMPTIELMIKIVDTSITQQERMNLIFSTWIPTDEVASQVLIELLADFLLVRGRLCVWRQTFGVLLFADFLRELVFYFLIAWVYYSKIMVESKAQSSKIARMVGLTAVMS